MILLVCGGRDFTDMRRVREVLDAMHASSRGPIKELIHGDANGADSLARNWATDNRVSQHPFPADWNKYGPKKAGPIRNAQMLREGKPEVCVAFPGGTGTENMIRQAISAGLLVIDTRSVSSVYQEVERIYDIHRLRSEEVQPLLPGHDRSGQPDHQGLPGSGSRPDAAPDLLPVRVAGPDSQQPAGIQEVGVDIERRSIGGPDLLDSH